MGTKVIRVSEETDRQLSELAGECKAVLGGDPSVADVVGFAVLALGEKLKAVRSVKPWAPVVKPVVLALPERKPKRVEEGWSEEPSEPFAGETAEAPGEEAPGEPAAGSEPQETDVAPAPSPRRGRAAPRSKEGLAPVWEGPRVMCERCASIGAPVRGCKFCTA